VSETTWDGPGRTVIEVAKPSEDDAQPIAINSWKPIPAGGCGLVTFDGPAWVLVDGTAAAGEEWGATNGLFTAKKNAKGLMMLGGYDADRSIAFANFYTNATGGGEMYLGKVSGSAIASGASGQAEQYGELWVAMSVFVTVLNPHDVELPSGLRIRWGTYPGWTSLVAEPFDYTECGT
jgi:hypothetical protein